LFQPPAVEELRDEVEFDVLGQLDGTPKLGQVVFC
jgi:hypothetical protein